MLRQYKTVLPMNVNAWYGSWGVSCDWVEHWEWRDGDDVTFHVRPEVTASYASDKQIRKIYLQENLYITK